MTRRELDFYRTPDWAARAIANIAVDTIREVARVRRIMMRTPVLGFDPSAGDGILLRAYSIACAGAGQHASIGGIELDAARSVAADVAQGDANDVALWPHERHTVVVMNPPYRLALEHVEHALRMRRERYYIGVFALLQLGFLASRKRRSLFERYGMPCRLHVFERRPWPGIPQDFAVFEWSDAAPSSSRRIEVDKECDK